MHGRDAGKGDMRGMVSGLGYMWSCLGCGGSDGVRPRVSELDTENVSRRRKFCQGSGKSAFYFVGVGGRVNCGSNYDSLGGVRVVMP